MRDEEIVSRRFGPEHERECQRPQIVTCALWECQVANVCQYDPRWSADYQDAMTRRATKGGGE